MIFKKMLGFPGPSTRVFLKSVSLNLLSLSSVETKPCVALRGGGENSPQLRNDASLACCSSGPVLSHGMGVPSRIEEGRGWRTGT